MGALFGLDSLAVSQSNKMKTPPRYYYYCSRTSRASTDQLTVSGPDFASRFVFKETRKTESMKRWRRRRYRYLLAAFIAATAFAELVAIRSQGTNHVCSPSTADGAVDGPFRQRSR